MTRITIALSVAAAAVLTSSSAPAQRYTNYPVCAVYGGFRDRTESCAFMNLAQCQMSVSGRGGYCTANPFYQPPPRRVKRKRT